MMRLKPIIAGVSGLLLLCLIGPAFSRPPNCGGNSAALLDCRNVCLLTQLYALDRGVSFDVEELPDEGIRELKQICDDHWIGSAKFHIRRGELDIESNEIIVVCDTPFNNFPRRWVLNSPEQHAVGYADGSVGLISLSDFEQLDLSDFIDVAVLSVD